MRKVLFFITLLLLSTSLAQAARMPTVGGDNESWGTVLNDFLNVSLNDTGYLENDMVGTNNIVNYTITDADISDSASINTSKIAGLVSLITSQNFSAANIISGILSVARGGTGFATYVVGDILYANSTSTLDRLAVGNATQVLVGGSIPNWAALTSSMFGTGVILSDAIANRNITADKIAIGAVNATHIAAGAISANVNLSAGSVNSTHILSNTIQGVNINTNANLTVGGITVAALNVTGNISIGGTVDLNLSTVTDDCSGLGCTSTANCPAGKRIIIGFTGSTTSTCDNSPLVCNGYCTTGATSCAVTEDDVVVNVASVRIVCGRI